MLVDLAERLVFGIGVKAVVADGTSDGDVIFLLDKAVIVFPVRAATSKRNAGVIAVIQ